jgi:putative ATP-dependent endonuclease of the OLD family
MPERSRLVRLRIANLGCIGAAGVDVEMGDVVCLVGANNTGKSTVLRAYEAAVGQMELKTDEIHTQEPLQSAVVEMWVHIPAGTENVDEKWKESKDGLLLVRSRWEWSVSGGKPVRTTWDPDQAAYAENGKAAGLDTVFNSRLPKPFRIGSLQSPDDEHKRLLDLVLDPIRSQLTELMKDESSPLRTTVLALQAEAEKPLVSFQAELDRVQAKVNASYRSVFSSGEVRLTVGLGDLTPDPAAALARGSRIDVREKHGQTRWSQQGTGSQRALFWSMLEVRSELNRALEQHKQHEKLVREREKALLAFEKKLTTLSKADAIERCKVDIAESRAALDAARSSQPDASGGDSEAILPGYMLLIDEPETALHPSAVRAAKRHLYGLAEASGWQVMLSTHHPAFVDPLGDHTTIVRLHRPELHQPPNVYRSEEMTFSPEDRDNLKSLLAFDSTVAEMFFGPRVVIVEGDTEFAAFAVVMDDDPDAFPIDARPLVVRARGKATIPTLVRILTHFKVDFAVLHDIDSPRTRNGARRNGAYSTNDDITAAVAEARRVGLKVVHRCSCPNFELHHGMTLPDKDKPFAAWKAVQESASARASVRAILDQLLSSLGMDAEHPEDGRHFEIRVKTWAKSDASDDPAYKFESDDGGRG